MEGDAGAVLGEDPGLERPDPGPLGALDQLAEELPADAAALSPRRDVYALLGHAGVDLARRVRRERGPADDLAVLLGHEAAEVGAVPVLPGRRLGFERGLAGRDPLLEDGSHGRPVLRLQLPDHRASLTGGLPPGRARLRPPRGADRAPVRGPC